MNKKKVAVLTVIIGALSYAAYQTGKSKVNQKNQRAVEVNLTSSVKDNGKFDYYSENEIAKGGGEQKINRSIFIS